MAKVTSTEVPVEIRNWTVWVEPDDGEDWGELNDDTYGRDKRFRPVTLCVIVTQNGGSFWSNWSQARGGERGAAWVGGTAVFEDRAREWMPQWARDAEQVAVDSVKGSI